MFRRRNLTIFGRSLLLLTSELAANIILWVAALILWSHAEQSASLLNLALLAWTLGLRHALDADHISAIDNATRSLIGMGQLPVTCGLFFSLGHSTIVVTVNIAIAVSVDVANRIDGVGSIGGIIGASVSGSFLFIIGVANSVILFRILRERRRKIPVSTKEEERDFGTDMQRNTIMMKIIGPVLTFVDRPWKLLIVGILFGFGFDTASSIALLAVSAIANGHAKHAGEVVILPLLFTAGMTMVDSIDSVLMLYSYAGIEVQSSWAIFEKPASSNARSPATDVEANEEKPNPESKAPDANAAEIQVAAPGEPPVAETKKKVISDLSIALTAMSILVAFSISIITLMGLIGDQCAQCRAQAEADEGRGGGLGGRWWRFWAKANDNSQWIGTGIIGAFLLVVLGWYSTHYILRKIRWSEKPSTVVMP